MNYKIEEYKDNIKEDLRQYAKDNAGYFKSLEDFRDEAWVSDSVTGNGSGSYFCNSAKAEDAIGSLIWDEDLKDMFSNFGYDSIPMEKGPEFIDVSIRCFLLDECISEIEEELKELLEIKEEE